MISAISIVTEWIGPFGYNEFGVCIEGKIQVISLEYKKAFAYAHIAKGQHGWVYGMSYGSQYTHTGAGSGSHGCFIDSRHQYRTEREATVSAAYDLVRGLEHECNLYDCPLNAIRAFDAVIMDLKMIINGEPEPSAIGEYKNNPHIPMGGVQFKLF